MPALRATIGADNSAFKSAMGEAGAIATKVGTTTVAALQQIESQIQSQMVTLDKNTTKWENFASALKSVRAQLIQTQTEMAVGGRQTGKSTILNPKESVSPQDKYGQDFQSLLEKQDQERKMARADNMKRYRQKRLREESAEQIGPDLDGKLRGQARENMVQARADNMWRYKQIRLKKEAEDESVAKATKDQINKDRAAARARAGGVGTSAASRKISRADSNLENAFVALSDAESLGGSKASLKAERDAVAQAIRARRKAGRDAEASGGHGGIGAGQMQIIHSARATIDSLASGGSPLTILLQQGPQVVQGFSMMKKGAWDFAKTLLLIPVGPLAIAAGVLAGAAAGIWIYTKRVASAAADMVGPMRESFNTEHIAKYLQKANILLELQKNQTEEARRTQEAHDSVAETMDRQLAIVKDQIAFERELLEIKKQNELATATTPMEREAIEKKYSKQILANKKKERDAELQSMKETAAALPDEIAKTKGEIAGLTGAGYYGSVADEQVLKNRQANSAVYDDYRKQLKPGEKDTREFSADKDKAFLSKNHVSTDASKNTDAQLGQTMTDSTIAQVRSAQKRLKESADTKQSVNDWEDSGGERERARSRVKELEQKVLADQKKLDGLTGVGGKGGAIADEAKRNLAADQHDLELEKARAAKEEPRSGKSANLTEWQRAGGGMGGPGIQLLDVNKQQLTELRKLNSMLKAQNGGTGKGVNFGGGSR